MAVQLKIDYETLVELVEQLPASARRDLLMRLLKSPQSSTAAERLALLDQLVVDLGPVQPGYSDRRADWYGEDER